MTSPGLTKSPLILTDLKVTGRTCAERSRSSRRHLPSRIIKHCKHLTLFSLILRDNCFLLTLNQNEMNQKFIVGVILASVANFLLGWLVWGILLIDTMTSYSNPACTTTEMNMPIIAVGQVIWGLLTVDIF